MLGRGFSQSIEYSLLCNNKPTSHSSMSCLEGLKQKLENIDLPAISKMVHNKTIETVVHLGIRNDQNDIVWYLLISYTSPRACKRTRLKDSGMLQIRTSWRRIGRNHRGVAD